jgi:antitoxin HicB
MLRYPVTLKKDGDTLLVTAPDFPEVGTFGMNKADALVRAADSIATALLGSISDRE